MPVPNGAGQDDLLRALVDGIDRTNDLLGQLVAGQQHKAPQQGGEQGNTGSVELREPAAPARPSGGEQAGRSARRRANPGKPSSGKTPGGQ